VSVIFLVSGLEWLCCVCCVCVCVCDRESKEGVAFQFVALPLTQSIACVYFCPLPEILPLVPRILTLTFYSNTLSMFSALTKTM